MSANAAIGPLATPTALYTVSLQAIPTADLVGELEAQQWLVADLEGAPGCSFDVAVLQLQAIQRELRRRERLISARNAPKVSLNRRQLRDRIADVKAAWPIELFCEELLGARLERRGTAIKACCPLPGHDEKTPSFTVYAREERAWCFGCNRGGDVIKLTQYTFGYARFLEALERLEAEGRV